MKLQPLKLFQELFFGMLMVWGVTDRGLHLAFGIKTVRPHQNHLCIGECYTRSGQGREQVNIDWELSTDFDHSTKGDIYALRSRRVEERPELVAGTYIPTRSIFGLIKDYLPWWGFDGYYRDLRSPHRSTLSSSGKSLRGEEIINPFYLVSLVVLTYSVENDNFQWNAAAHPSAEGGNCPYWPAKSESRWTPAKRRAEVTYYVQDYARALKTNHCLRQPVETTQLALGIDPVNAQDLGFNFLSISRVDSKNISVKDGLTKPRRLNFFYHRGTSCAQPEGCNNISPLVESFRRITTTDLPAKLVINLWEHEPLAGSSAPDLQYIMNLE